MRPFGGHDEGMANYQSKGLERMRELGRRGGENSGKTRQEKRAVKILVGYAAERGIDLTAALLDSGPAERLNRSGGSLDTDWRCPTCHHFSNIKRRLCAICGGFAPRNGRLTRAALRERAAEHRTQAILRKHGL